MALGTTYFWLFGNLGGHVVSSRAATTGFQVGLIDSRGNRAWTPLGKLEATLCGGLRYVDLLEYDQFLVHLRIYGPVTFYGHRVELAGPAIDGDCLLREESDVVVDGSKRMQVFQAFQSYRPKWFRGTTVSNGEDFGLRQPLLRAIRVTLEQLRSDLGTLDDPELTQLIGRLGLR